MSFATIHSNDHPHAHDDGHAHTHAEAQAQSTFLAALFRQNAAVQGATPLHGDSLQAYRGTLAASVERGLAAIYPSVLLHLGAGDFDALAQLYLAAHPPLRGDWAQYGGAFPHWLRAQNPGGVVAALPFLPDLAALDAALYHAEAAADATLDASSLQALADDAASQRVVLHPAVGLLDCEYDVVSLRGSGLDAPAFEPHSLMVWRSGWRAQVRRVGASEADFVRFCLAGATIGQALQNAGDFDFERWLLAALQDGWIAALRSQ